jgi:hypothetical protein
MVASMGGLMARGFVQQPDYHNQGNFMKGYIQRLITIGTSQIEYYTVDILGRYQSNIIP